MPGRSSSEIDSVRPPTIGQRAFSSILVDALTANIAVLGFIAAYQALSLSAIRQPQAWYVDLSWIKVQSDLYVVTTATNLHAFDVIALFGVVFHFLLDDWQSARYVDAMSPYWPSPTGRRFYLDVAIAGLFLETFQMVTRADALLPLLFAGILLVGTLWSWVVFRAVRKNEPVINSHVGAGTAEKAAATCLGYVASHAVGAIMFTCIYAFFTWTGSVSGGQHLSRSMCWTTILGYLLWDRSSKWGSKILPGARLWARETIGCGLYKLAKLLHRWAIKLQAKR